MVSKVEAVAKVDAFIAVLPVVLAQGRQYPQLDSGRISVFLDRSDDFDSTACTGPLVCCFNYFAESALSKEPSNLIWQTLGTCHTQTIKELIVELTSTTELSIW